MTKAAHLMVEGYDPDGTYQAKLYKMVELRQELVEWVHECGKPQNLTT